MIGKPLKTIRAVAATTAPWPWLSRRVAIAWSVTMLALFLGLLSIAAVSELSIDCRDEPVYLLTEGGDRLMLADGSGFLLTTEKRRTCRLGLGSAFTRLFPAPDGVRLSDLPPVQ
jgi:hypothetical protein